MNTSTIFPAKKLIVTAQEINLDGEGQSPTYQFPVWQFENGAILVEGVTTNDWFFDSQDEIEPNGTAIVIAIEETEETITFDKEELKESVEGSEREFGYAGLIKELL